MRAIVKENFEFNLTNTEFNSNSCCYLQIPIILTSIIFEEVAIKKEEIIGNNQTSIFMLIIMFQKRKRIILSIKNIYVNLCVLKLIIIENQTKQKLNTT